MDFPQSLPDHMPEKSDPIAQNGKQNVLVYRIWQNLLKFLQGAIPDTIVTLFKANYLYFNFLWNWLDSFWLNMKHDIIIGMVQPVVACGVSRSFEIEKLLQIS